MLPGKFVYIPFEHVTQPAAFKDHNIIYQALSNLCLACNRSGLSKGLINKTK